MSNRQLTRKGKMVWPSHVEAGALVGDTVGIGLSFGGTNTVFAMSLDNAKILFEAVRAAILECQMDAN